MLFNLYFGKKPMKKPHNSNYGYTIYKDFPKERYNTYAKSCNSNLYTKYPGATYSGLLLGTMSCL